MSINFSIQNSLRKQSKAGPLELLSHVTITPILLVQPLDIWSPHRSLRPDLHRRPRSCFRRSPRPYPKHSPLPSRNIGWILLPHLTSGYHRMPASKKPWSIVPGHTSRMAILLIEGKHHNQKPSGDNHDGQQNIGQDEFR